MHTGEEVAQQSAGVRDDVPAVPDVVPREDHEVHQQARVHSDRHIWVLLLQVGSQGLLAAAEEHSARGCCQHSVK